MKTKKNNLYDMTCFKCKKQFRAEKPYPSFCSTCKNNDVPIAKIGTPKKRFVLIEGFDYEGFEDVASCKTFATLKSAKNHFFKYGCDCGQVLNMDTGEVWQFDKDR